MPNVPKGWKGWLAWVALTVAAWVLHQLLGSALHAAVAASRCSD